MKRVVTKKSIDCSSDLSNSYEEKQVIRDIYKYLKNTDKDDIYIRTTYCKTGQSWHDDEFDANAAGFNIYRFINTEYRDRHEFAECYRFVRK